MAEKLEFYYSEKSNQRKCVNHWLIIVLTIFYLFYAWIMVVCNLFQNLNRTVMMGFVGSCMTALAIAWIMYKRNRSSDRFRWIAFVGLFLIASWSNVVLNSGYLMFMSLIPLILFVFYFDRRFTVITSVLMASMYQTLAVLHSFVFSGSAQADKLNNFCSALVMILLCLILIVVERMIERFNRDTYGRMQAEQDIQRELVAKVIHTAGIVQEGTEEVLDKVNVLSESADAVTNAMRNISESTISTAESIQIQTSMTQDIQQSIGETIRHSENMVHVAEKSRNGNEQNLNRIRQLKNQSFVIAELNQNVSEIMRRLKLHTESVKGIADTIFAISSQTNLLALNASIESARAGEAGRGFAVVSDEIRQLAEKTRQETENIANVLKELSDNAEDAVKAVNQSSDAAKEQEVLINQVVEGFEEMNQNVSSLNSDIIEIDRMLEKLSGANNQIVDNISNLSATTEEVTASAQQAEELSENNLSDADLAKEMLGQVMDASELLKNYINNR